MQWYFDHFRIWRRIDLTDFLVLQVLLNSLHHLVNPVLNLWTKSHILLEILFNDLEFFLTFIFYVFKIYKIDDHLAHNYKFGKHQIVIEKVVCKARLDQDFRNSTKFDAISDKLQFVPNLGKIDIIEIF